MITVEEVFKLWNKPYNINKENEILAAKRYAICFDCENRGSSPNVAVGEVCKLCDCHLNSKVNIEQSYCPINKWKDIK
jgi:hypothetical protein